MPIRRYQNDRQSKLQCHLLNGMCKLLISIYTVRHSSLFSLYLPGEIILSCVEFVIESDKSLDFQYNYSLSTDYGVRNFIFGKILLLIGIGGRGRREGTHPV